MRPLLFLTALAFAGCATTSSTTSSSTMPQTFILVHGAFADAHAFDAVKPMLEARGHRVIAVDLPGHGADTTALKDLSFEKYVTSVHALVEAQPAPVVLVGHSMAGLVVAQVAERAPSKVRQLVFVAAYLPKTGQSLEALAKGDPTSLVGQNMQFAADSSTVTIKKEALADALAADLPKEVQGFIVAGHKPEPLAPFQGKVTLSDAAFGSVPRSYVFTTADRAVTPSLQQQLVAAWPNTKTASLATGHLPFLSQPQAFVNALLDLTTR
ncbi:MAG: alpha/beta fold hydrolase [Archangiaceae bacterium]|nr:alpha/beta fold hydrolase [Archangiaceae bacterium]